jgi:hypothetical protein
MANVDIRVGKKNAAFFSANPTLILKNGQFIFNETTSELFIGDGVTQLSSLVAINGGGGGGSGFVPYTGATQNTDLGTFSLNAKSLHVKGTGGAGHLGLKHQSSNITASASESSIGANSLGNPIWKNDGNPIENILLQSNITQTITNGVTDKAPSEDAVFDALASLSIASLTRQEFTYTTGAQTFTLSQSVSGTYAVFVNGQELNQSQYTSLGTTLTILDTLDAGDKVNILYSNVPITVNPSYTKAESDANFEPKNSNIQTKLGFITVTQAVNLDTIESDTATNNAKVSNATHTGEVTGSGALTIDKTAITNKTTVTPMSGDFVLVTDVSDSDNLKKVDIAAFIPTIYQNPSVATSNITVLQNNNIVVSRRFRINSGIKLTLNLNSRFRIL